MFKSRVRGISLRWCHGSFVAGGFTFESNRILLNFARVLLVIFVEGCILS